MVRALKIVLVTTPTKEEVPPITEVLSKDFTEDNLQRDYYFFVLPPYIEAETSDDYKTRILAIATALMKKYKKRGQVYVG